MEKNQNPATSSWTPSYCGQADLNMGRPTELGPHCTLEGRISIRCCWKPVGLGEVLLHSITGT